MAVTMALIISNCVALICQRRFSWGVGLNWWN